MRRNRFTGTALLLVTLVLTACSAQSQDPTQTSSPSRTPVPQITDAPMQTSTSIPATSESLPEYEIISLLPKNAIQAIDDPVYQSAQQADAEYDPDELVIGVEFNGDARAYSIPLLSQHEIVNDTVGGVKIAVTW